MYVTNTSYCTAVYKDRQTNTYTCLALPSSRPVSVTFMSTVSLPTTSGDVITSSHVVTSSPDVGDDVIVSSLLLTCTSRSQDSTYHICMQFAQRGLSRWSVRSCYWSVGEQRHALIGCQIDTYMSKRHLHDQLIITYNT